MNGRYRLAWDVSTQAPAAQVSGPQGASQSVVCGHAVAGRVPIFLGTKRANGALGRCIDFVETAL